MWNVDADGSWTTASNWTYLAGPGPNTGYPNGAGDQAFFTGTYTAARRVTIPANTQVTVGVIYFSGPQIVEIAGAAPSSRLMIDNGASPAEITTTGPASSYGVSAQMFLRSSLVVNVIDNNHLALGRMVEDGGVRTLTKRGGGYALLFQANSYTGLTKVERGILDLMADGGGTLRGDLEVGTGSTGSPAIARTQTQGQQLQATSNVEVKAGGTLWLMANETVGQLRVNGGFVQVYGGVELRAQALTMNGGVLEGVGPFTLAAVVTATSTASGPAVIRSAPGLLGRINLVQTMTFVVNDGPAAVDLEIVVPVSGIGTGLVKDGAGTLRFTGTLANTYGGETHVRQGLLELARAGVINIPLQLRVGGGPGPARVLVSSDSSISDYADVTVDALGTLELANHGDVITTLRTSAGGSVLLRGLSTLRTAGVVMNGGHISLQDPQCWLLLAGVMDATSTVSEASVIDGSGALVLDRGRQLLVGDGPQPIDLRIGVHVMAQIFGAILDKRSAGTAVVSGESNLGLSVAEGTLLVTGTVAQPIAMSGGRLGGTGSINGITATGGEVAPGLSPGRLTTTALTLDAAFVVELNGIQAGTEYDQLDVRGTVTLGAAALALSVGFTPPSEAQFTIIANDGTDPVIGTFANLPEGGTIRASGQSFTISYHGGDGNDVVLTTTTQMTYYLAEGATGSFFDDDVLIANPNDREAPVTLLFMKEGGDTIVDRRVVPAMARLTVSVDRIPGLESTAASVQVVSDQRLPLVVERSMFWDASYYGGHTANAVAQPETRWTFAEGFQGFFDTYILIANAEATPTTATLTFLREGGAPVVATVPVGAFSRRTVYAGDYPALKDRAFGIVVEATHPVIAERAMYFSSSPGRLWAGGHANTGTVAPSRSWFHAEGATGGYFSTFILLSNPQSTPAQVTLRFLLSNGDVITRTKTLAAQQRLTVNPAGESDVRLLNAAVSTVVEADVPIVSERSMYWPGEAAPFGEGHNSSGIAALATRWGLAEGRIGGPHAFDTFILLANPSGTPAQVTVTYLRDDGAPIVRTHTVPATSRFNIDVKSSVPELRDTTFGARIEVTNAVPIAVERSLYWNANGVFWAGGTNALGTPLP
jgi:autotransporter-associated beta strand protein